MYLRLQIILWGFILHSNLWAGSANTTMGVSATVTANCTISTTSALDFGNYVGTTINDKQATLKVNCTNQAPYRIALGTGGGPSVSARRMMSGNNSLSYELYQDSNRTVNWGMTNQVDDLGASGTGTDQIIPVYGKIVGGINAAVGNYSDTVQVTINY